MNRRLVTRVLAALVEHCYHNKTDVCPSTREVAIAVGEKVGGVNDAMDLLAQVGILDWPKPRKERAKLLLLVGRPNVIPIAGTLGGVPDFVPGSRWIDVQDGHFYIGGREYAVVEDGGNPTGDARPCVPSGCTPPSLP